MFLRRFYPTTTSSLCLINNINIHLTARRLCSTNQESLESKFQALQTALSKQQIALAGLAKKVVNNSSSSGNDNVVVETLKNEMETVSSSVLDIQRSVSKLESKMNEMEQELLNLKKSNYKITSVVNNDSSTSSVSNSRLLSELVSRISAIESKQAIIKISQKNQQFDNSNFNNNNNNSKKSDNEPILVSMEPGVDGTPRLLTCQVKVFHPTAIITDIRSLMETAGPVVSCLRKPGESNNNNNNRGNANKSPSSSSSSSKPCFVVTFQNTIDAARAIENVAGILIRGVAVQVESCLQPEQMLVGNN